MQGIYPWCPGVKTRCLLLFGDCILLSCMFYSAFILYVLVRSWRNKKRQSMHVGKSRASHKYIDLWTFLSCMAMQYPGGQCNSSGWEISRTLCIRHGKSLDVTWQQLNWSLLCVGQDYCQDHQSQIDIKYCIWMGAQLRFSHFCS